MELIRVIGISLQAYRLSSLGFEDVEEEEDAEEGDEEEVGSREQEWTDPKLPSPITSPKE